MNEILPVDEKALRQREGDRLVNIVQGRDDGRTLVCHYLVIERPPIRPAAGVDKREIEPYRDIERLVQNALDLDTGDRDGKWLGAFTGTYRDGKLVAVALVENMPVRLAVAKHNQLRKHAGKNILTRAEP